MSPPADDVGALTRDNLSSFDAAPQVGVAARPWALPLGILGAVTLGVLTFMTMNANRTRPDVPAPATPEPARLIEPAPAPAFDFATEPEYTEPSEEEQNFIPLPPTPIVDAASEAESRLRAPALIIDLSNRTASASGPVGANAVAAALSEGLNGDERFAARLGGAGQSAQARALANPSTTIPQGMIIAGVLETAIDSDLPGYVRALVSRDVSSFDGSRVLVPRGSRLIGQYRADTALGQSRAFVIWTRLMRPDGVTVELNSPSADELGRGGLAGETDRHFLGRFGSAILLTLFGAAANAAADSGTQVIIGAARTDPAGIALNEEISIGPTIRVPQGQPIRIFVSRDLDFSAVDASR